MTFNFEIERVKAFLCKNAYPPHLIDKQVKKYIHKTQQVSEQNKEDKGNIFFIKLPYIGSHSDAVQNKIKELSVQLCKDINIKLVFTTKKISSFFSTKDVIPSALRSHVVYNFTCASCNASYVGQTTRHFNVRVNEHLNKKSNPSGVFKHLEDDRDCRQACDKSCFKVIDSDQSSFRLQIKEAIHNVWLKPTINKQKQLFKTRYFGVISSYIFCLFLFLFFLTLFY